MIDGSRDCLTAQGSPGSLAGESSVSALGGSDLILARYTHCASACNAGETASILPRRGVVGCPASSAEPLLDNLFSLASSCTLLPASCFARPSPMPRFKCPATFNALVARMIEAAGFEAAYLSGWRFGWDAGLARRGTLHPHGAGSADDLPHAKRGDTDHRGRRHRLRRAAERAPHGGGAGSRRGGGHSARRPALPKRCGHLSGKSLVEPEEMCRQAPRGGGGRRGRRSGDHRPHRCPRRHGFDEAVQRALRYLEAGADCDLPRSPGEPRRVRALRPSGQGAAAWPT